MPLARDQRIRLARVLTWSRSNGWTHDAYPNTWRSTDGQTHVRFDALEEQLVVDNLNPGLDPIPRYQVAIVPVDSPDLALRVLAALGHIPTALTAGEKLQADLTADDQARATYQTLMAGGRHAYMSTYCQHELHDDCKRTCKCCDAPCVCSGCPHTPPEPTTVRCLKSYGYEDHPLHLWERDDEWVQCLGWPLQGAVTSDEGEAPDTFNGSDAFDGPASFVDAGQAFADWVDGRIMPDEAAEVLSKLARAGLIISVAYHDEATGDGPPGEAALMADVASIIDGTDR